MATSIADLNLTIPRPVADLTEEAAEQQLVLIENFTLLTEQKVLTLSVGDIGNPLCHLPLLNAINFITGVGSVTVTRSTIGTYLDFYDVVQTAAIDITRFEKAGRLHEPASQNDALWSRDLTNAVWIKALGTAAKDATGHDGGTNTASSFTATSANATCLQIITNASETRTFSVDLKRRTGSGSVEVTLDGGSTWTNITASLSTTRWTRAIGTQVIANSQFGVRLVSSGDVVEIDYVQNEAFNLATSRIETTTAAVPRALETFVVTYAGNCPAPVNEYTIVCDFSTLGDTGDYQAGFWINDEVFRGVYFVNPAFDALVQYYALPYSAVRVPIAGQKYRVCVTFDGTRLSTYEDGVLLRSDVISAPVTGAATAIEIGSVTGGLLSFCGHITNFRIYNKACPSQIARIL